MELSGGTALVTGAAAGIGRAVAAALAAQGSSVVLADVDREGGRAAARELGGRFVHADVTQDEDVRTMIAAAGTLNVLVNNAGGAPEPHYPAAPVEHWSHTLELNLHSAMLATQLALESMRGRGGAIVNVASMAGYGLFPHGAPEYAAAKAGLMRLTGALAPFAKREGIRVNCICPDWVDTPAARRSIASMSDEERAHVPDLVPPEEIAALVLDLLRDDSLAGAVMIRPADGPPMLMPVEGPCG